VSDTESFRIAAIQACSAYLNRDRSLERRLPFGHVSGLICWENDMPLARYALAAWDEQIHVAPTWDRGEPWLSTMRLIAKEGRSVVVSCCQVVRKDAA